MPTVPTVTLIVCVTPLTAVPTVSVPAEAVVQLLKVEITAVPLLVADVAPTVVLEKEQLGVVFNVKLLLPAAVGVPVAVKTRFCAPVVAKVPEAAKVTPFAIAEML